MQPDPSPSYLPLAPLERRRPDGSNEKPRIGRIRGLHKQLLPHLMVADLSGLGANVPGTRHTMRTTCGGPDIVFKKRPANKQYHHRPPPPPRGVVPTRCPRRRPCPARFRQVLHDPPPVCIIGETWDLTMIPNSLPKTSPQRCAASRSKRHRRGEMMLAGGGGVDVV